MSIRSDVRKDEKVVKLRRIVSGIQNMVNLTALHDELESLHSGRKVRHLKVSGLSSKSVIDAVLQDQSYRSRVTEIVVQSLRHSNNLSEAYDATLDHLIQAYDNRLDIRTKSERQSYLKSFIAPANKLLADLNTVVSLAEYIVEDIDKAGYALKNTIQALEISSKREYLP